MKTNYSIYHDSFTACATEARRVAESQDYQVCETNWQTELGKDAVINDIYKTKARKPRRAGKPKDTRHGQN